MNSEHCVLLLDFEYSVLLNTVCYWTHVLLHASEHGVPLNMLCYSTLPNTVCY
jgi:hypothetical protein